MPCMLCMHNYYRYMYFELSLRSTSYGNNDTKTMYIIIRIKLYTHEDVIIPKT